MTELLTAEELTDAKAKHKHPGEHFIEQGHAWDWMWSFNPRAIATIEAQQAQIRGLVEVVQYHLDCLKENEILCNTDEWPQYVPESIQDLLSCLSTLPATFLERERLREEVVRAAREWQRLEYNYGTKDPRTIEAQDKVWYSVKALEAGEG